jgi:Membrane-bound serine protease (ClpP class)
MNMAGLFESINTVALIFFAVGIVLLTIEMFLPGIGIFGALGFVCLVLCIVFQAQTLTEGLILLLIISAIVAFFALMLARSFKKGRIYRSGIVLKNEQTREEGFVAGNDMSRFSGKRGVSITTLRPAGTAAFDGERIDVLTEGEFIPAGIPVEVARVEGMRVFVKNAE